jgi:hypothetical protein
MDNNICTYIIIKIYIYIYTYTKLHIWLRRWVQTMVEQPGVINPISWEDHEKNMAKNMANHTESWGFNMVSLIIKVWAY